MSENNITIRLETKDDYRAVENLTRESFWNVYRPGCMEHYVLHCYRDDPAFVPELGGKHSRRPRGSGFPRLCDRLWFPNEW